MERNECSKKKSIVDELTFGRKTARRVHWEAFEFTIVGPQQVKVTNASYGYLADDHAYVVDVTEDKGEPLPGGCTCPADDYSEEYDCKHKVALADKGGTLVLDAAMAYEDNENTTTTDEAAKAKTDGGVPVETEGCDCSSLGDLPCWPCYQSSEEGE